MATLLELYNIRANSSLQNRIVQGAMLVAQEIIDEAPATTNHVNRVKWAVAVMKAPDGWGDILLRVLVAKNPTLTIVQLTGVTDEALLTALRTVVNTFADNLGT
jgi:hypothetical protein